MSCLQQSTSGVIAEARMVGAPRHRPGEAGYRRVVIALFAASVATFAALYSTQPLIGALAGSFQVSDAQAAWSVSVATLLLGVGMLLVSPASDRWGRTTIIKFSLAASALLGGASALAPTWPLLLAARAAQGLALAGTPAVALVYLREEVDPLFHPRATGLYIGGTAIGGMTGRLLAGAVVELTDWRYAVGAVAILATICAIVVAATLPPARHGPRRRRPGDSNRTPHEADARRGGSSRRPQAKRSALWAALTDPRLIGLYAIAGTTMGAFVAVYNVLGLRLTARPYGLSTFAASLVFCVYPFGSVGAAVAGRVVERLGRPGVVLTGCLFTVAGLAVTLAAPLPIVILGVVILTIGFFVAHGVASGWATTIGQQRAAASSASALYFLAYYLGSSVFGALGTALWSSYAWSGVVAMDAALLLIAATCAVAVALRTRRVRL
jgi:YNFM family putative membrane transporter